MLMLIVLKAGGPFENWTGFQMVPPSDYHTSTLWYSDESGICVPGFQMVIVQVHAIAIWGKFVLSNNRNLQKF